MRVLKSLLSLLCCFSIGVTNAQDSTFTVDSAVTITARDSAATFQADTPTGTVQWHERTVPESTLQHLRNDAAFWYANADIKKKKEAHQSSFLQQLFSQKWFYNLLWLLIIGSCIAVLILFFTISNLSFFRKQPGLLTGTDDFKVTENIFSMAYDEEIKKAIRQEDFHLAIRLHFLHLLTLLDAKNLIQYQDERTNQDYLQELKKTNYFSAFKKLTYHFEYAWYGRFPVSPALYQLVENDFANFKKDMGF